MDTIKEYAVNIVLGVIALAVLALLFGPLFEYTVGLIALGSMACMAWIIGALVRSVISGGDYDPFE